MNIDEKYKARLAEMREYTYQWMTEDAEDPSKPILKITKSSLGQHEWCPKKYDFSYLQRLPQDQTEAMRKGTVLHNHRENFFNDFDIKKAESLNHSEVIDYCTSLMPVDEYFDISVNVAAFEAQRFIESKTEDKVGEYLPIVNEGMFDAEITFAKDASSKYPLSRDYVIHIQGIIDRIFIEGNSLIPFEYKTGAWKERPYKYTSMRKEMGFYKLLIENSPNEVLEKYGLNKDMEVTHWGWYYPVSNFVYTEKVKTRTMSAVTDSIAKLLSAYENREFNPKFFFRTCQSCSYFGICEGADTDSWL